MTAKRRSPSSVTLSFARSHSDYHHLRAKTVSLLMPRSAPLRRGLRARGLEERVQVYQTSHIGGHKYAGNVVAYGAVHPCDGDWFGGINAGNAQAFLDALLGVEMGVDGGAEAPELRPFWRGRMGLSKEEQLALFEQVRRVVGCCMVVQSCVRIALLAGVGRCCGNALLVCSGAVGCLVLCCYRRAAALMRRGTCPAAQKVKGMRRRRMKRRISLMGMRERRGSPSSSSHSKECIRGGGEGSIGSTLHCPLPCLLSPGTPAWRLCASSFDCVTLYGAAP